MLLSFTCVAVRALVFFSYGASFVSIVGLSRSPRAMEREVTIVLAGGGHACCILGHCL